MHEAKLELEDLHTSTPMELECRLQAWVGREPSVEQQRRSQRIHDRVCSSNKMTCHIAKPLVTPDSSLFTRYHIWGQAVKLVPDLLFLKDLTGDQYYERLVRSQHYLERHNNAHCFADAGRDVRILEWEDDRSTTCKFDSVRERYNGRDGTKFYK